MKPKSLNLAEFEEDELTPSRMKEYHGGVDPLTATVIVLGGTYLASLTYLGTTSFSSSTNPSTKNET